MENTPGTITTHLSGYGAEDEIAKAANSAHGAVDKVAASAEEAANAIKPAIGRVADAAHQTVDRVTGVAEPAAEWLNLQGEILAARGRDAVADARAFVVAHPWQSLGAALAFGYLVGRRHLR